MSLFLGIDTSNYTTSVATAGDRVINLRKIIDVKEGMRGIRQSDGVFVHLKELPNLFEQLDIDMTDVKAVGVSTRPRSVEGSYMPVFVAGESFAKTIAKALNVPLFRYSHQDGHIMAAILSGGYDELLKDEFTAVHLSGGTTEILSCNYTGRGFDVKISGGTKDISAGQLIDRVGVRLGMKFPCGKQMDALSLKSDKPINIKTSQKDGYINFSGAETAILKLCDTEDAEKIARTTLEVIGKSLKAALDYVSPKRVLFVGGVASNTILRGYFKNFEVYFAEPELSCDNAAGIAELCRREWEK